MAVGTAAISPAEAASLFKPWRHERHIALAVSGGADSVALMWLLARWRKTLKPRPQLSVFTVDHGLRAAAADEAQRVVQWAGALGLEAEILRWQGDKPRANIQQAARQARYLLLADACDRHGVDVLMTAHHLQDQAETVLLRLGRGSGVDGLAAMEWESSALGMRLARPLLDLPPERLRATLARAKHDFFEDPSNENSQFARVRMRKLMGVLEREGLSARRLADTAGRMRRAREALEHATDRLAAHAGRLHEAGFCEIARAPLDEEADEIVLRLLVRVLTLVGGQPLRPRAQHSAALLELLRAGFRGKRTLHGCRIEFGSDKLIFWREAGRDGLPVLKLKPGDAGLWDGRVRVMLGADASGVVEIKALGPKGWKDLKARKPDLRLAAALAHTCPSAWRAGKLIAVPGLFEGSGDKGAKGLRMGLVGSLAGKEASFLMQGFAGGVEDEGLSP